VERRGLFNWLGLAKRRYFRSLYKCIHAAEPDTSAKSRKGREILYSITLLRAEHGALFPRSGRYSLTVAVDWRVDGVPFQCTKTTEVTISKRRFVGRSHRGTRKAILKNADFFLWLVQGDQELGNTAEMVKRIRQDQTLRNHYSVVDAKWSASREDDPGRLEILAKKLLEEVPVDEWVVTDRELRRLRGIAIQLRRKDIAALYDKLIAMKS